MDNKTFDGILTHAVRMGASDVHMTVGDKIRCRVDGNLIPLPVEGWEKMTGEQVEAIASLVLGGDDPSKRLADLSEIDCSYGIEEVARFRVNIFKQRGEPTVVMRAIPHNIPSFDDLALPPVVKTIASVHRGFILVSGTAGSGKTTTQASMIDYINERRPVHIITLEEPIEFLHYPKKGSVSQRDVGIDTPNFHQGLRSAIREDPDVILIGEMRDPESIDIALTAAETGHLVISTVHSEDVTGTINRVISAFRKEEASVIRLRLAESLSAIISQRLLIRKGGRGRIPAVEILVNNEHISQCIMDEVRTRNIRGILEQQRTIYGCQTFEQHLIELLQADLVDMEAARAAASNLHDFDLKVSMLPAR